MGNNTLSGIGITLIEYTGVSTSVTYEHVKTHNGLYAISIQSIDEESEVTFSLSLKQKTPKKLSFRPNGIKIKTGGQKISLRWNLRYEFCSMPYGRTLLIRTCFALVGPAIRIII